jgi:hypothetical protein
MAWSKRKICSISTKPKFGLNVLPESQSFLFQENGIGSDVAVESVIVAESIASYILSLVKNDRYNGRVRS